MAHILVAGATGFIGRHLVAHLLEKNHRITVATRDRFRAEKLFADRVEVLQWNPRATWPSDSVQELDYAINLMGENIGEKRWSREQKQKIEESRVLGTTNLVESLVRDSINLKAFISTSAIGHYQTNRTETLHEDSPRDTLSFLGNLCGRWEAEALAAPASRVVILRLGVVLGEGGGVLSKLRPLFSLGLGGPVGGGKQMMSWIHMDDLIRIYGEAVENSQMVGVYNATAPQPTTNLAFSKALAHGLSRPCFLPVPALAVKLLMGEMATLVLDGQKIIPKRLNELGFRFRHRLIESALGAA